MKNLTGTAKLIRLFLRRDRIRLPIWLVAITVLVYSSAVAVQGLYTTQAQMDAYAGAVGSSAAAIIMSGPPTAVDTIGGITIFEINTTTMVATALMAIFLVVRHTRGEEEEGRTELIRSTVVGRHAPMAAAVVLVGLASIVLGAAVGAILAGVGLDPAGASVYGASIAGLGLAFTAVGAGAAQVGSHARGALGIAGTVVGVTFILRGIGDIGNGVLSWLSPFGWAQAARPFAGNRWWPLLILVGFAAAMMVLAAVLNSRRDVGAGLVQPRPGPARADPRLGTATGLATRLQRGSVIAWVSGMFVGGLSFGSVGQEVTDLVDSNPEMAEVFATAGADLVDAFFSVGLLTLAIVASGFTISSALRLRTEETAGRAEPLLATGLSRTRWMTGSLLVTLVGTILVVGAGGLGLGLAHSIANRDVYQLPRLLGASLVYVPGALALGAVGVLLFGWLPRWSKAAWAGMAFAFVVGWLGLLLSLPEAMIDVSPFSHISAVPADPLAVTPLLVVMVIALAGGALGVVGLRRRDIY